MQQRVRPRALCPWLHWWAQCRWARTRWTCPPPPSRRLTDSEPATCDCSVRLRMPAVCLVYPVVWKASRGRTHPLAATLSARAQVPPSLGRKSALSAADPGGATTFLLHVSSQLRELACGRFYCDQRRLPACPCLPWPCTAIRSTDATSCEGAPTSRSCSTPDPIRMQRAVTV